VPFLIEKLEDRHCCVTVSGDLTAELVIDLIEAVLSDDSYQQTQGVVVCADKDLHLSATISTLREIETYSKANDHRFSGSKWAVVTNKKLHFGLARMYQTWRDDASYQVVAFRSIPDAVLWLSNLE